MACSSGVVDRVDVNEALPPVECIRVVDHVEQHDPSTGNCNDQ